MSLALLGIRGIATGKTFMLTDMPVLIGRNALNDIDLTDVAISRHHCRLIPTRSGFVIEDLASANGTVLNGQVLTRETSPLHPGDIIDIGSTRFIVIVTG